MYTPSIPQTAEHALDLFSTSATPPSCINHAPYLCIPPEAGKPGYLYQLCCNDWLCPRCGELRAKHEYGRMVEGLRKLSRDYDLYFITLTAPGQASAAEAEENYLRWTHRLLTALQAKIKRSGGYWCYAAVTERQQRGTPHSHMLTTFASTDAFSIIDRYADYRASVARINAQIPLAMRFTPTPRDDVSLLDLHSEWLHLAAVRAGLGVQVRLSMVDAVEGASRYVAKYLFKSSMFTSFPPGWRRVRYSRNFPKLPEAENSEAFPLLTQSDWERASRLPGELICRWLPTYEKALSMRCLNAVLEELL